MHEIKKQIQVKKEIILLNGSSFFMRFFKEFLIFIQYSLQTKKSALLSYNKNGFFVKIVTYNTTENILRNGKVFLKCEKYILTFFMP
jgi:hypothetical protein